MGCIRKDLVTNRENFWNAVKVYCEHSNAFNKEIICTETWCTVKIEASSLSEQYCRSLRDKLHDHMILKKRRAADFFTGTDQFQLLDDEVDIFDNLNANYLIARKLLPKKTSYCDTEFYEICFFDTNTNSLLLYSMFEKGIKRSGDIDKNDTVVEYDPLIILKFDQISVHYNGSELIVKYSNELGEKGVNWLNSVFVNKVTKIMLSKNKHTDVNTGLCFSQQISLINYYRLYEILKLKYAKFLIENWSENTDPKKFVFEDIGIATYLLLLWNGGEIPNETSPKQRFVDLGCGNGLLVYILNSEGHGGIGLDVRKRKIWTTYPSHVILKEEAVIPGPSSVYPDADWLIGNHSDELTPWLPVMARRSGPRCQYFVLPCCPFHLNGLPYQRKNSGLSVYNDFVRYVRGISEICRFETHVDKLRIPSTKRIAIMGRKRDLSAAEVDVVNGEIDRFIEGEFARYESRSEFGNEGEERSEDGEKKWIPRFRVRQSVESVRNCTKLPKELVNEIVRDVANGLLQRKNLMEIREKDGGKMARKWNRGGEMTLREIANLISPNRLQRLKNECKGLQTLVKNHHYVFRVNGNDGTVRLRSVEEMAEMSAKISRDPNNLKRKQKNCWFHANHPDGCPLPEDLCSYKH